MKDKMAFQVAGMSQNRLFLQDPMISQVDVVENGPSSHRCQVVHWTRTFPFAFITKRDYVIARRLYKENGCLYGITKVRGEKGLTASLSGKYFDDLQNDLY